MKSKEKGTVRGLNHLDGFLLGSGNMADDENTMSLRVAKAIPSDVGHGRARISGENDLGLKPGDIVEIKGEKRSTAAIYWRSRPEDTKMEIIRVDGIIRKNAGVSLGDLIFHSRFYLAQSHVTWIFVAVSTSHKAM